MTFLLCLSSEKKIFADSSFYDEPEHKYPTMEEQIKMARQVALSLSTADNVAARGQQMFRKRKEKASGGGDDDDAGGGLGLPLPPPPASSLGPREEQRHIPQLFYNTAPWKAPQAAKKKAEAAGVLEAPTEEKEEEECHGDPEAFTRNRAVFERGVDVQRREPPWKKTALPGSGTKTSSQPESKGLTKDLRPGATGGRGAKLFAQKRSKALKEEEEEEEVGERFGEEGGANGFGEIGDHVTPDPTDREEAGSKPDLTPWQSKAVGQKRLTAWQTVPAASDAKERGRDRERSDDIPNFIGWILILAFNLVSISVDLSITAIHMVKELKGPRTSASLRLASTVTVPMN